MTPVVAFLSDSSVLETLVPGDGEVDRIFNHPLESLLDPSILEAETLVEAGTEDWPYPEHVHVCWKVYSTYSIFSHFNAEHERPCTSVSQRHKLPEPSIS